MRRGSFPYPFHFNEFAEEQRKGHGVEIRFCLGTISTKAYKAEEHIWIKYAKTNIIKCDLEIFTYITNKIEF